MTSTSESLTNSQLGATSMTRVRKPEEKKRLHFLPSTPCLPRSLAPWLPGSLAPSLPRSLASYLPSSLLPSLPPCLPLLLINSRPFSPDLPPLHPPPHITLHPPPSSPPPPPPPHLLHPSPLFTWPLFAQTDLKVHIVLVEVRLVVNRGQVSPLRRDTENETWQNESLQQARGRRSHRPFLFLLQI